MASRLAFIGPLDLVVNWADFTIRSGDGGRLAAESWPLRDQVDACSATNLGSKPRTRMVGIWFATVGGKRALTFRISQRSRRMKSMQTSQTTVELKNSLDALETSIATPIVAGDLAAWIDTVNDSWTQAASQIQLHLDDLHLQQFEEIANQDPELLPRVDALKAEDESIKAQLITLDLMVGRSAQHVPRLAPDEEKAAKFTKRLIDDTTQFIARVRKQAVAVQTWYVEAFQRDRGAVD
jgi:hypothetical protein